MSTLKTLQQIDNLTKLKICGYIREYEQNNNKNEIIIPIMIQYIIMLYYWINEKFSKHGELLQVHGNSKIVSVNSFKDGLPWYHQFDTVYGNSIIVPEDASIAKYKWSIKYSFNPEEIVVGILTPRMPGVIGDPEDDLLINEMLLGITSEEKPCKQHFMRFEPKDLEEGEVGSSNQYMYHKKDKGIYGTRQVSYKGGVIHLSLDMKEGVFQRLSFSLDTDPTEYNIYKRGRRDCVYNYKYRLTISMYLKPGNECELINFEIFHKEPVNPNDIDKEEECIDSDDGQYIEILNDK